MCCHNLFTSLVQCHSNRGTRVSTRSDRKEVKLIGRFQQNRWNIIKSCLLSCPHLNSRCLLISNGRPPGPLSVACKRGVDWLLASPTPFLQVSCFPCVCCAGLQSARCNCHLSLSLSQLVQTELHSQKHPQLGAESRPHLHHLYRLYFTFTFIEFVFILLYLKLN